MSRDSKKRNYLLKIVERCVIGAFIFMMGLFGMYSLRNIASSELLQDPLFEGILLNTEDIEINRSPYIEGEEVYAHQEIAVEELQQQIEESSEAISIEESEQTEEVEVIEDEIIHIDVIPAQHKVTNKDEDKKLDAVVDDGNIIIEENRGVALTDEELEHLQEMIQTGQDNLWAIVSNYINQLDVEERVALMNLSLQKAKHIDIGQIWNLVEDGISEEDLYNLQGIIEEHFTGEEIELLYQHYMQYAEAL